MNTYTHTYQGAELKPYERVFRTLIGLFSLEAAGTNI